MWNFVWGAPLCNRFSVRRPQKASSSSELAQSWRRGQPAQGPSLWNCFHSLVFSSLLSHFRYPRCLGVWELGLPAAPRQCEGSACRSPAGRQGSGAEPAGRVPEEPALASKGVARWLPLELSPCCVKNLTGALCGPLISKPASPRRVSYLSLPQAHC